MKKWTVNLTPKAYKQLKKLPAIIQDLADDAMSDLENHGPTPKHWDIKKIQEEGYRIRLNYRYRMRYTVESDCLLIDIFYIGHRKDAY